MAQSSIEDIEMRDRQPLLQNESEANCSIEPTGPWTEIETAFEELGTVLEQRQQQPQRTGADVDESREKDIDVEIAKRVKNITAEELRKFICREEWIEMLKISQCETCIMSVVERLVDLKNPIIEEDIKEQKDAVQFVKQFEEKKIRKFKGSLIGKLIERKWEDMVSYVFDCMLVETVKDEKWEIYYTILEEPYDDKPNSRTVFQELSTRSRSDLVDHNLMRLLTFRKWENIKLKRILPMIPYLLTLICLTILLVTSVDADNVMVYNSGWDYVRLVFEVLSIVGVVFKFTIEILQLKKSNFHYFSDPLNIMELGACVILLCLTLPWRFIATNLHWYAFAVGYATWVLLLYKYAALCRPLFFQAQIFIQVFRKDVPMFGCLFLIINLAFSGSLLLAVRGDGNLDVNMTDTSSWSRIFFMGIRTLAEGQPVLDNYAEDYGTISTIVIVAFLFLVVVTLLNMLIAQLGQTLANVNETMCTNYHENLAATVAWMEINHLPCCHQETKVECGPIRYADMLKILKPRKSIMENIQKNVDSLIEKQEEMAKNVQLLKKEKTSEVEKMKEIQKKLRKCLKDEFDCITAQDIHDELKQMKAMVKDACQGMIPEISDADDRQAQPGRDEIDVEPVRWRREGTDVVDSPSTEHIDPLVWKSFLEKQPQELILGEIQKYIGDGKNPSSVKFEDGTTPLHIAVTLGYFFVVRMLLELGGNMWKEKVNALKKALEKKYDHMAAFLVEHMNSKDPDRLRRLFCPDDDEEAVVKIAEYFKKDYEHFLAAVMDTMWREEKVDLELFERDTKGKKKDEKDPSIFHELAHSDETDLFSHVVIQFLIWKKWKKCGYQMQFIVEMVFYLISLLCITVACVLSVESKDVKQYSNTKDYARVVFESFSILFVLYTICIHGIQMKREKLLKYLKDCNNLLELVSSVMLLLTVPLRYLAVDFHWYWFAIGYFLWVLIAFKYSTVNRALGTYAQSLYHIITRDMLQFICLFVVILIAFSGSFLLVLKGDNHIHHHNETSTFWGIAFTGLRAMADGQNSVSYYGTNGYERFCSLLVMIVFLFVTIVILLNILIAQLSNTYTDIQGDAQNADWVRKAKTIARLERQGLLSWLPCFKYERESSSQDNQQEFCQHVSIQKSTVNRIDNRVEGLVKKMPSVECTILGLCGETKKCQKIKMDFKEQIGDIRKYLKDLVEELPNVRRTLRDERKELQKEIELLFLEKYSKK